MTTIDEELVETSPRSENLKMTINSDGPVEGTFGNSKSQNLVLKGIMENAPEIISTEATKHFTNWDAALTSIDNNTTRFEFQGADEILGHCYNAEKIKIVEDMAAISYPNYTHLNKVVWEHETGGIYQPWVYSENTSYDTVVTDHFRQFPWYFLPLINHHALKQYNIEGDYSNLFIVIEHDGYYTDTSGSVATRTGGQVEVFKYVESDTGQDGTYFFDENYGQAILRSRFSVDGPMLNTHSRTNESQVTSDISRLNGDDYLPTEIADTPTKLLELVSYPDESIKWGFLGYSKVSLVKYQPVVKCGRVDLFKRKSGPVTSLSSNSVISSVGHNLQNGDAIKITGNYGEENLDGIKYVQVNDDNNFTIYEDDQFNDKTEINTTAINSSILWTVVGSDYGWKYLKSITSPTGKNGMGETWNNFDTINPISINGMTSYAEIFQKDCGFDFSSPTTSPTYTDFYNSVLPVRNNSSNYDSLWSGENHYIHGYRFGMDIDLIKDGNNYKLLVGEPGVDEVFVYSNDIDYKNLPVNEPHGRAHLITITSTGSLTLEKTINASSDSSSVISPPSFALGTFLNNFFYTKRVSREDSAESQSSNVLTQDLIRASAYSRFSYLSDSYWYGSLLYHLPASNYGTSNYTYYQDVGMKQLATEGSDLVKVEAPFKYTYIGGNSDYIFYGYADSFGKSVALCKEGGNIVGFIGSTTRPNINNNANSCGYVHVYNFTSENMDQKIAGSGGIVPEYRSYLNYSYKGRAFAKTIRYDNGYLYFGESKSPIFIYGITDPNFVTSNNEVSKIYRYKKDSSYSLVETISNVNDFTAYFTGNRTQVNYKVDTLHNVEFDDLTETGLIFHGDRFGDYFDVKLDVLVTNSFDIVNDLGEIHNDKDNVKNQPIDYINVFEFRKDAWVYAGKLSPSIDSQLSKYSYSSLHPRMSNNLRVLNNKNYDNDRTASISWDMDLSNCFGIADDRVILKDPLGYAIFRRNWNLNANPNFVDNDDTSETETEEETTIKVPVYPYFSYSENFLGYEEVNVLHTKFAHLHEYSTFKQVSFSYNPTTKRIQHSCPVYFLSLPDVTPLNKIDFTVRGTSLSESIKMVIMRRDPRLTIVPESNYVELDEEYAVFENIPGDMFVSETPEEHHNLYRHGVMDFNSYHDYTAVSESIWGEVISPTLINNELVYSINFQQINTYKLIGSRLQNSIRVFNRKDQEYVDHLAIDMEDSTKETYDSSILVDNTLIVGFIYENTRVPYKIPDTGFSEEFLASITSVEGKTNPISQSSQGTEVETREIISVYDCIYDAVTTHTNFIEQQSSNGSLIYSNPVLGIGTSNSPSKFDIGSAICSGTYSESYQILSVDSITKKSQVRSLDIQELETLSILLYSGGGQPSDSMPIIMPGPVNGAVTNSVNLFTSAKGENDNLNLHIQNVGLSDNLPITLQSSSPSSGQLELFLNNNKLANDLDLYISSPTPASGDVPLYISGPIPYSGSMPITVKSDDPIGVIKDLQLMILGITPPVLGTSNNGSAPATIFGVGGGDFGNVPASSSMSLYIGNNVNPIGSNDNLGIYLWNDQTQNTNFTRGKDSTTLFIGANYTSNNSAFLHIHRNGIGGGEEAFGAQSLRLHNEESRQGLNMYLTSATFVGAGLNASISGTGYKTNNITTFIRGYEE